MERLHAARQDLGRVRLSITYDDGANQALSYYVIKPAAAAVADWAIPFHQAVVCGANDPFHRSPSVMTYDRANNRIVTQDARAWIAGLAMREAPVRGWRPHEGIRQPKRDEIAKFEEFIDGVLWATFSTAKAPPVWVKKSLFFHDPAALPEFLMIPDQLGILDELEQSGGGIGQPRLRLPARGGGVLGDVSHRA